jgi:hypothetical protein
MSLHRIVEISLKSKIEVEISSTRESLGVVLLGLRPDALLFEVLLPFLFLFSCVLCDQPLPI